MDQSSEFLVLKSTEQQKKEGAVRPVDTASIEDINGTLVLKALFDVQHFKPEEVYLEIKDRRLTVTAQCFDDEPTAVYRKTLLRTLDLPEQADTTAMQYNISPDGILNVEMPFHLPQQQPSNPALVPIVTENGRRKIHLQFMIGSDFAMDDVKVKTDGRILDVSASYEAEVGVDAVQVTCHELKKKFILPESIEVDEFVYSLQPDGCLHIEILIKDVCGQGYRCSVTTEDVTGKINV
jgi:HSP20 family molecular chaperone IbpA